MPIPANQITVAEISLKGLIASGGSNTVNTNFIFHYRRTAVAVNPSKPNLAAAFNASVGAAIAAALNVGWTGQTLNIRWVNDPLDQYSSAASALVGAIAGDRLATDQAAYLLFRTGIRGRSYRGSKHLGPMSESDVTTPNDDLWNAGALARLAAINTALLTPLNSAEGNTWNFTLLSRKLSNLTVSPANPLIVNDVIATLVSKRTGSMVRRKVKSVY